MADWTSIPDTTFEPGAPAKGRDARFLRDNPIAIAEGASGAPRVQTAALQNGAVTKDKLQPPTGSGAHLILRLLDGSASTTSANYFITGAPRFASAERHIGVTVLVPGVVRVTFEHRLGLGTTAYARVLKNGSQIQEFSTSSSSFVSRSVDVSVDVGDSVILQQREGSGNGSATWQAIRFYSGNPSMAVA